MGWILFEDTNLQQVINKPPLMYSTVNIDNNIVLYSPNLLRN